MARKKLRESDLYPAVERWLRKRFNCFATKINRGTNLGRIDVVGLRDIGGDLSGKCELISVEVKAGSQPFAIAAGQANGYSVYAERCYLADLRRGREPFREAEISIASKLGIGLLALREDGKIIDEILTSPVHEPIESMRLEVIERLGYSPCTICGALFERGDEVNWGRNVKRGDVSRGKALTKAVREGNGLIYWIDAVSQRQRTNRHRRYVCPDCVWNLYRDFVPEK